LELERRDPRPCQERCGHAIIVDRLRNAYIEDEGALSGTDLGRDTVRAYQWA